MWPWLKNQTNQKKVYIVILALVASAGVIFFWHVNVDDAFISYRYALNAAHGHGLVYNIGDREEGYSNPLWVLVLTITSFLQLHIVYTAKILGIISACAISVLIWKTLRILHVKESLIYGTLLLFVTMPATIYWSVAGLETMAYTAVLFASFYILITEAHKKYPYRTTLIIGLLPLIRPEGIFYTIIGVIYIIITNWKGISSLQKRFFPVIISFAPFVCWSLFRHGYYGLWSSLPAIAKSAAYGFRGINAGWNYVVAWIVQYPLLCIGVFIGVSAAIRLGAGKAIKKDSQSILIGSTVLILGQLSFTTLVGGDWMLFGRFVVPVVPYILILTAFALQRIPQFIAYLAIIMAIVLQLKNIPSSLYQATVYGPPISTASLSACLYQKQADVGSVAFEFLGIFGYYSQLPLIDDHGLIHRDIAAFNASVYPGDTNEQRLDRFKRILAKNPDYFVAPLYSKSDNPTEVIAKFIDGSKIPRQILPENFRAHYIGTLLSPAVSRPLGENSNYIHLLVYSNGSEKDNSKWASCISEINEEYYYQAQNRSKFQEILFLRNKTFEIYATQPK